MEKRVEKRKPHEVVEARGRHSVIVTEYWVERKLEQQHITEVLGLSADGKLLHFRLHAHRLHKQQIPQGGLTATVFEKYLLLLEDLLARCQWAEISPETRLILADRKERPLEVAGRRPYDFDAKSFDLYNR